MARVPKLACTIFSGDNDDGTRLQHFRNYCGKCLVDRCERVESRGTCWFGHGDRSARLVDGDLGTEPGVDLLLCRGPLDAVVNPFDTSSPHTDPTYFAVAFLFEKNLTAAGDAGERLAPGTCAWPDRPLGPAEPATLELPGSVMTPIRRTGLPFSLKRCWRARSVRVVCSRLEPSMSSRRLRQGLAALSVLVARSLSGADSGFAICRRPTAPRAVAHDRQNSLHRSGAPTISESNA